MPKRSTKKKLSLHNTMYPDLDVVANSTVGGQPVKRMGADIEPLAVGDLDAEALHWVVADEFEAGTGVPLQFQRLSGPDYILHMSKSVSFRLKAWARQHGMSELEVVEQLMDFYNLRDLDLLIDRVKKLYLRGLTPIEKGYLGTLYTLLYEIDKQIGL